MPRSPQSIPAKSDVLKWARDASGYSLAEASRLLGITEPELAAIETGDRPISSAVFQRMTGAYQRVESVLLLPYPPDTDPLPEDYRTVGLAPASLTPETLLVIREARRIQHYVSDLLEEERELFQKADIVEASIAEDTAKLAARERQKLGITVEMQMRWKAGTNEPFDRWRMRIQDIGILVLLKQMPWDDCRGLSLWGEQLVPVVVVNSEDAFNARVFTLFHEYAHLILREAGVCITDPMLTHRAQTERWCNSFAAHFLVPSHDLKTEVETRFPAVGRRDWTMQQVNSLANRFKVSRFVMARRLKEFGFSDFYDTNIAELRRYDHKAKPKRTTAGSVRPEKMRLSEVGVGVASILMDAWRGHLVDAGEAADILNLRVEDLGHLSKDVEARRSRRGV